MASGVEVQTLGSTGMPLGFDSVSVTQEKDQGNRALLKFRVTSTAEADLVALQIAYVVFRPDGSVRGGGNFVQSMGIPAKSWAEEWTLLQNEVSAGDRVVLSIIGASSATMNWQTPLTAFSDAAKALIAGRSATMPTVRPTQR